MPTWNDTTLCTLSDVEKYVTDWGIPLIKAGGEKLFIERKIALVKSDFIKPRLQELFTKVYADTVGRWIEQATSKQDDDRIRAARFSEQSGAGTVQSSASVIAVPFFFDTLSQQGMPPRTYYNSGTPTDGVSGTFAGAAPNGAYLVDYHNGQLYVNSGTTASPAWTAFVAEDLVDKITNASVLKRASVAATIWLCLEDGAMRDNAAFDRNMEMVGSLAKRWKCYYDEWFQEDVTRLQIDISGNGTVSEYERTRLRRVTSWIA